MCVRGARWGWGRGEDAYHYHDVVLVTYNARLRAERQAIVRGVRRADDELADERRAAVLHPCPAERPAGAAPDLIRAERLQLHARVRVRVADDVERRVEDRGGAFGAEAAFADELEGGSGQGVGCETAIAVDCGARLIEDGRDQNGLANRWERRGRVQGTGKEGTI